MGIIDVASSSGVASVKGGRDMLGCKRAWGAASVAAMALVLGASAVAGTTPNIQISVEVGDQVFNYNPSLGSHWQNPDGSFGFYGSGSAVGQPFQFSWDLVANPNSVAGVAGGPPTGAFIIANTLIVNTLTTSQTVVMTITQSLDMPMASTLVGGSVAGAVSGGPVSGGASSSGFLYQALADGDFVAGLVNNLNIATGPFGSVPFGPESFGTPIPNMPYGAINNSIAIQYAFSLAAGSAISLTGTFVAVPAPGALALLGLAAIAGTSRRRRR